MTESITIYPLPTNSSPAQAKQLKAPDIVNDNFLSSFKDILDTVNPLQQLPIVSSLYREFTDSTISSGARIVGGTLYGGPIGLLSAVANSVVETISGKDIGANLIALITGDQATKIADANTTTNNDFTPSSRHSALNSYIQAQSLLS